MLDLDAYSTIIKLSAKNSAIEKEGGYDSWESWTDSQPEGETNSHP